MLRLGFWGSGAAATLVAVIVGAVLVLLTRWRWRIGDARREEIMRLALMAAAEAARAEEEAEMIVYREAATAIGGGGGAVVKPRPAVCVVCFCPTMTRCSRCKSVRYCSGKCQIIHWRQGHKDECHPPQFEDSKDDQIRFSKLEDINSEQHELCPDSIDIDKKSMKRTSSESSYSLEPFSNDELVDTSLTESTSDSSSDLSTVCSTFSGPGYSSEDSFGGHLHSHENGSTLGVSSLCSKDATAKFDTICSTDFEKKVSCNTPNDVRCDVPNYQRSENNNSDYIKDLEPSKDAGNGQSVLLEASGTEFSEMINCTESKKFQNYNCIQLDARSHLQESSKLCDQNSSAERTCKDKVLSSSTILKSTTPSIMSTSAVLAVKPEFSSSLNKKEYTNHSKNMKLQGPASVEQVSTSGQEQDMLLGASVKVKNIPKDTKDSYQKTISDASSLKPSAQKVVQQLKLSKLLKQSKAGSGDALSKKSKFLFPYESFVKLCDYDKVEIRPSGLVNCGNSCYANAVIQCLVFTPPITAYLLQGLHSKACLKTVWCFTCELENLIMKVKQGKSPLSPSGILSHIHKIGRHFGHGKEEDAHEFLRYAIDIMQSVCLKEAGLATTGQWAEVTTLIQLTFGGYLLSKIKCMKCHYKSEQHERMMDLTVEIQGDIGTLEEALRRFTATEILDGDNKYRCDRCKSYERARKKLTIFEAPNILTVALKRFQSGKFGKINKVVHFPLSLDLTPYMSGSNDKFALYKLYAVVVHLDVMNAAFSGHYVCYVRSARGRWYKADDSTVKAVDPERVLSKSAYMLLYARCSPHAPSLIRGAPGSNQISSRTSKMRESFSSTCDAEKQRSGIRSNHAGNQDKSYSMEDNHFSFDLLDGRLLFHDTDSSSDHSSLFSCSDEGSCSTQSTRNSTSTDEFSEYIFGNLDQHKCNSPSRYFSDMDNVSSLPINVTDSSLTVLDDSFADSDKSHVEAVNPKLSRFSVDKVWDKNKEQILRNEGGTSFLYSDRSSKCNKLTEHMRSRETNLFNSHVKHNTLSRSSTTRERTAQPFY